MKKALFVTTIGGFLPQFEKNDVRILRELGCEIHYASNFENPVYSFDRRALEREGILLHHIDVAKSPAKLRANARAIAQLKRVIDGERIDLIHCHNPMGGVAARIAAGMSRRRPYVIYTAHGFHFYRGAPLKNWLLYYPAEKALAGLTDRIIAINGEDERRAERFSLRRKGHVSQIHGVGVDSGRFFPDAAAALKKRNELAVPADAFHIVTAAELNDNKNQRVVIEAIARIGDPDIYYSLCGRGPGERALRELIRSRGLEGRVRLLGYRTDMEEVLRTADCFAFPSKREGLGVAAVEALLTGVPLIAADNRGTREYAVEGRNSLLCRAESVQDFARAIRILSGDAGLRRQMAAFCRASALCFTSAEVAKTMRGIYEETLRELEDDDR